MLAIIGGSGLYSPGDDFELTETVAAPTPWGDTSAELLLGRWHGERLAFLPRHGPGHALPPHRINYRANLWALGERGVRQIIAVNAVGGIDERLAPLALAVPEQLIDYTSGREHSFAEGGEHGVRHVDFTAPYDAALRRRIVAAAARADEPLIDGGIYGCTNGPRLETAAEIRRLRDDGCTMVGMTGMPEAALARELDIGYACLALVVNRAAGLGDERLDMRQIVANLERGIVRVRRLLRACLADSPR